MGKTSQKQKEKRLAGRVSLALAAGMFSVVPVAHGMPTGADPRFGGATVGDTIADPAFAEYIQYLILIVGFDIIQFPETVFDFRLRFENLIQHCRRNTQFSGQQIITA